MSSKLTFEQAKALKRQFDEWAAGQTPLVDCIVYVIDARNTDNYSVKARFEADRRTYKLYRSLKPMQKAYTVQIEKEAGQIAERNKDKLQGAFVFFEILRNALDAGLPVITSNYVNQPYLGKEGELGLLEKDLTVVLDAYCGQQFRIKAVDALDLLNRGIIFTGEKA